MWRARDQEEVRPRQLLQAQRQHFAEVRPIETPSTMTAAMASASASTGAGLAVASYSIRVSVPVAISAAAQIRSRFNQARRSMPTPSFSKTSTAMNAVTAR